MITEKVIEIKGLQKSFGEVQAVKGVDFYVGEGQLFSLLGENGAGKSTTISMLSTLLRPDGGEALIGGYKLGRRDNDIRRVIGIVFQDSLLDNRLTVRENLLTRASFYYRSRAGRKEAAERAAEAANTGDFIDRPYGKLSGGQRRRADIARALLNTPKILFLDEPTTGLDPQTRQNVWQTIRDLQKRHKMTVFLTTHYMEEAAKSDYITILGRGEVLAQGTPTDLRERYSSDLLRIKPKDKAALEAFFHEKGIKYRRQSDQYIVSLRHTTDALPILDAVRENIESVEVTAGTMDDVFLNVTGKGEQEHGNACEAQL